MAKFNVIDHEMVPDHTVLDEEEVEELLERYDINKTDLPKMSSRDAAVKEIGASPGDVVKVERESRTAEKAVAYRLVIED